MYEKLQGESMLFFKYVKSIPNIDKLVNRQIKWPMYYRDRQADRQIKWAMNYRDRQADRCKNKKIP